MAADDLIYSSGTQTTVITGTATRAAGAFSTTGEQTNEITSNLYPLCQAVLQCTFSVAPTEGDLVHLYARRLNTDGANDDTVPEAGYEIRHMGSFPVKDITSAQYITLDDLRLFINDQSFYIENDADQTMSSGYTVKILPYTYKPSAS